MLVEPADALASRVNVSFLAVGESLHSESDGGLEGVPPNESHPV